MNDWRAIQAWWSTHPMTYGSTHGQTTYADGEYAIGTEAFFARLDEEFLSWNTPLHAEAPFGRIFPYARYRQAPVLEIGCGLGTMAGLWAEQGAAICAVDLSPAAVALTRARWRLKRLPGQACVASAHALPFGDAAFAYAYSWGVLHHSPDLARSIAELRRVLRPGGGFGVMLYHRDSILYRYLVQYVEGFLHDEARWLSDVALASRYGDGAREEGNPHTWPVTRREMRGLFGPWSRDLRIECFGTDLSGILPLLLPGLGGVLPGAWQRALERRWGWSLWITGCKR